MITFYCIDCSKYHDHCSHTCYCDLAVKIYTLQLSVIFLLTFHDKKVKVKFSPILETSVEDRLVGYGSRYNSSPLSEELSD